MENDFEIEWDPDNGVINASDIEGFDAVIHLGGEGSEISVGPRREKRKYSPQEQEALLSSRKLCLRLKILQKFSW